ncbi:MAG: hypothetical protein COZ06_29235 [Armatimonadetes bacterium CG_4_10_14_3_um_filter_66_18]|nr:DUF169 domain-containing protein [Armatimonadota bacterium]OIO98536.1 MAG: hypothetical protein AUJ96_20930 [Armatimonadetes bacterium CG2_30_66_41]PIU89301.1 MAG: hypothetical protein COS65_28840 [Armatimonadetes bacterium CG06_land_8_20_14_3_00_66_21]PIY39682.1 MAG: hypothetical protein COZ06_29235 [Armatimonadetes bacterium CG_4_10_14_3_um_filter_66_18]PIZ45136.1 MAG: hypothetical protein COY42_12710 [Armatimonadetes bacterium CG_4_10_14_0_8_um_filter_66_14]
MERSAIAAKLKENLDLATEPVAVKWLERVDEVAGFQARQSSRFCQALMEARHGLKALLTPENIYCPASAAAFGFKPRPEKLASGEMLVAFGIFGNATAARRTVESMPQLPAGKYAAVALCPLAEAPFDPDVVIVEGAAEQVMWLALADRFDQGGRMEFSTGVLQATCVDAALLPFVTGKVNASFGCYGCRDATDMEPGEAVIGFPGNRLPEMARNLEGLAAKAIPKVRQKGALRAFLRQGAATCE